MFFSSEFREMGGSFQFVENLTSLFFPQESEMNWIEIGGFFFFKIPEMGFRFAIQGFFWFCNSAVFSGRDELNWVGWF